jgi:N-6 DNA Methylase
MATNLNRDPELEWLDHVQPVGLVVAPSLLKELGLSPIRQSPIDTGAVGELLEPEASKAALPDAWAFAEQILGWEARHVAGAPGGPAIPDELLVALPEHATTLKPTWAVAELGDGDQRWQLLVRVEAAGVDPDARGALDGWEATPHQRFERLLRDTGVFAGVMVTDKALRLIYAPRGETSGYLTFPIRPLGTVAGRPMLSGLKLLLDCSSLFTAADSHRLPALLKKSRDAQAAVSTALAEQVLGALHELLRGLDSAEPAVIRELARTRPDHLYEGLLTVLMRLVFVLYAEDRDLLPSRTDGRAREIYETSYSVRGLYATLVENAALSPDTMDERRGGWGRLLALFRLIHKGHKTHFVQARGGKLFDPDEFPFLEGRATKDEPGRILNVSDGCLLRILEGLMTLKVRGGERERLSYRALDVEQIGSVYETVMGFTVEAASSRVLAIKAGKNNRTPVFVALDELLARKGKDRIKDLKENAGRGQVSTAQAKAIETATSADELAAALDSIVDERGSPRHAIAPAGSPILQPTDERRRTGSHYTPRSLTAPIVLHALEPAFERLGEDATPEQVLDLKVCDPAMGSGAFLVEACRTIGERLVKAWEKHQDKKPTIPADEDEELHARRLVAQRCLYGVDKNPRAVDLARLSLWLATLARDHEFTFLDHALKCGDSLVGLSTAQIAAATWDDTKPALPLFRQLVKDRVAEALKARAEIQAAPDDTTRAIQEARHRSLEGRLAPIRMMGDAVISAFFAADKPKTRETKRAEVESWLSGSLQGQSEKLDAAASSLRHGDHPIPPFHWEIEFPEVFARENGGFDAIVGNPPFAGKNTVAASNRPGYGVWLQMLHEGAHGNADLVAHFFRRAFALFRQGGVFGLIATNTIRQGDTRASGLTAILANGGAILRATRRLKWPGEAAVVVSVVHVAKGEALSPMLDGRQVPRISAYLVKGDLDVSPARLAANARKAFQGSIVLGVGFTFDDVAAAKGSASSLADMQRLIVSNPKNAERIFPYIGGEDLNSNPQSGYRRYVIDFGDASEAEARAMWPDLLRIVEEKVKPQRDRDDRKARRERWWRFGDRQPGLYQAILGHPRVIALSQVSAHHAFTFVKSNVIFDQRLIIFVFSSTSAFTVLQSRCHEVWARFFGSTMKDDPTYTVSECFRTFPFSEDFETNSFLEAAGDAYYAFRAQLMIDRNEGLTTTYNRLHARGENAPDIARLRALHAEMDAAVLRAYGWNDLADRAAPEFIEQDADEGRTPKTRLDWPGDFKDEVLARVLALNAGRAATERVAGLTAVPEDDGEDIDEEAVTEQA